MFHRAFGDAGVNIPVHIGLHVSKMKAHVSEAPPG
jgi:hypothetical protein